MKKGGDFMSKSVSRLIVASAFFVSALVIPAKADMEFDVAIGAYANFADYDTTGSELEGNAPTEEASTSISTSAEFGSIFTELNIREGMAGLSIGAEYVPGAAEIGTRSRTDTTTDADEKDQDDKTYTAKAEVDNHISIYIEPTLYLTESIGIYGKGGVARMTVNTLEDITSGTDSSAYGDESVYGTVFGFGMRFEPWFLLIKADYISTKYQEVKFTSTTGNKNVIRAEPESQAFRIGIGFQF